MRPDLEEGRRRLSLICVAAVLAGLGSPVLAAAPKAKSGVASNAAGGATWNSIAQQPDLSSGEWLEDSLYDRGDDPGLTPATVTDPIALTEPWATTNRYL